MPAYKSSDYSHQFHIAVCQSITGKYWSAIYDDAGNEEWHSNDDVSRDEVYEQACNKLDAMTEKWMDNNGDDEAPEDDRKNGVPERQFIYKIP